MLMIVFRTPRLVDSRTPVMAVLPWRVTKITERDAPRTQLGMSGRRQPALHASAGGQIIVIMSSIS
jgi:hypothetical protein